MLYIYVKADSWEPGVVFLTLSTHGPDEMMIGNQAVARDADCWFYTLLRCGQLIRDDLEKIRYITGAAVTAPTACIMLGDAIGWAAVKSAVVKCLVMHCGVDSRQVIVYDQLHLSRKKQTTRQA
jgi:hypothetical protein